jgi:hypothetical protein
MLEFTSGGGFCEPPRGFSVVALAASRGIAGARC